MASHANAVEATAATTSTAAPGSNGAARNDAKHSRPLTTVADVVRLVLIRHAESEENRRIESLKACCGGRRGRMSCAEVVEVVDPRMRDAALSDRGRRMIDCVRHQIAEAKAGCELPQAATRGATGKEKDSTGAEAGVADAGARALATRAARPWPEVDAYVHSALQRTRHTLEGLFPDVDPGRMQVLPCLLEKQPLEFAFPCTFLRRVEAFRRQLADVADAADAEHGAPSPVPLAKARCVVVVGHSQFFRAFLGASFRRKMDNVEVVACDFDRSTREVSNARSLFTHKVVEDSEKKEDEEVDDDEEEEEEQEENARWRMERGQRGPGQREPCEPGIRAAAAPTPPSSQRPQQQ